MNTLKRSFIKLALVTTLAGGMIGAPLMASAQASPNENDNNCRGVIISQFVAPVGKTQGGQNVQTTQVLVSFICAGVITGDPSDIFGP